jgi:ABC-type amino acid transport substrate-binding protein
LLLAGQVAFGAASVPLKVFRVGADSDFRPISFTDKSGKMIGYDVDFATALAAHLGVPLHYEGMAWDGIIPALQGQKIDAITDIVITDKRKDVVAFSRPYLAQTITTVVKADKPNFNPGKTDLAKLKVGVMVNTSAASALDALGIKATTYNTVADVYSDLLLGRIDVAVVESVNAGYTATAIYPKKLRVTGKEISDKPALIAVAMRKQDTKLVDAVNAAINAMIRDGSLVRVNRKWFGNLQLIPKP